jgi:hypothetical protein
MRVFCIQEQLAGRCSGKRQAVVQYRASSAIVTKRKLVVNGGQTEQA